MRQLYTYTEFKELISGREEFYLDIAHHLANHHNDCASAAVLYIREMRGAPDSIAKETDQETLLTTDSTLRELANQINEQLDAAEDGNEIYKLNSQLDAVHHNRQQIGARIGLLNLKHKHTKSATYCVCYD